jgi:hypothetical protein
VYQGASLSITGGRWKNSGVQVEELRVAGAVSDEAGDSILDTLCHKLFLALSGRIVVNLGN